MLFRFAMHMMGSVEWGWGAGIDRGGQHDDIHSSDFVFVIEGCALENRDECLMLAVV